MADRERSGDDGVKPNASSFHSLPLVTYYSAFPFTAADESQPCPAKATARAGRDVWFHWMIVLRGKSDGTTKFEYF
jgi:hypothetical protein